MKDHVRREERKKRANVKPCVAHVKDHVRREEIRKRANVKSFVAHVKDHVRQPRQDAARGPGPARDPILSGPRDVPKLYCEPARGMPSTTLTLHHRWPMLFTTSSPKDKRHNNAHFFDNALGNARWIVWILISNDISVDRSFHL